MKYQIGDRVVRIAGSHSYSDTFVSIGAEGTVARIDSVGHIITIAWDAYNDGTTPKGSLGYYLDRPASSISADTVFEKAFINEWEGNLELL